MKSTCRTGGDESFFLIRLQGCVGCLMRSRGLPFAENNDQHTFFFKYEVNVSSIGIHIN